MLYVENICHYYVDVDKFQVVTLEEGNTMNLHHKLPISQNFNKICAKIVKQYACAKSMGFKV
jgi:hypothetical protein